MKFDPTPSTKEMLNLIDKDLTDKWVLDLCCGSGWIGKYLKSLYPEAHVVCSDIRSDEFDMEDESIYWRRSNLFQNIVGKFDLIVMNPPYVPAKECEGCEPLVAFSGGEDGFDIIGKFLEDFKEHLTPDGVAIVEIYHTHGDRLNGWEILKDSQGFDRFAIFRN